MTVSSRRAAGWVLPLVAGALVLGVSTAHPAAAHGTVLTGPSTPRSLRLPPLGADYRVSWMRGHRAILLEVEDGARCRPTQPLETSTAPARIEVSIRRATAPACASAPRWWRYDLALPTVVEPGQAVSVRVDGRAGAVPRYSRAPQGAQEG